MQEFKCFKNVITVKVPFEINTGNFNLIEIATKKRIERTKIKLFIYFKVYKSVKVAVENSNENNF